MIPERCDIVFRNATVIDGTGAPRRRADLGVADDRIVAVGDLSRVKGGVEIDASGRVLAPGFIDVHTHDDYVLLAKPEMTPKLSQGVTTVVVGNCGVSLAPLASAARPPAPLDLVAGDAGWDYPDFGSYFTALDRAPPAINAAALVGHSSLRVLAMDRLDRAATPDEVRAMRRILEDGLEAGAIGFSTGLAYRTAIAAPTLEVIEIARALTRHRALYVTHMRNEGDQIFESIDETLAIGRAAEVPVIISHHKTAGAPNFGRSAETLPKIAEAAKHQKVGLDVYPYPASSTVLSADMIPRSTKILVAWSKARPEFAGRDLKEVAAELGCSQEEAVSRLLPAGGIYFAMDEGDVRRIMAFADSMIGSDGLPNDEHPHPRLWGTFPRVLGHYARELGLFGLEAAVRKMTGLSAHRFGLKDRGVVRAGAFADLVMFDPETVIDRATFERPVAVSDGIDLVMVNGRIAWKSGAATGARAGRALRRQDQDRPML